MVNNPNGVDPRAALEILAARQQHSHGECHHHDVPTEAHELGQEIDLGGGGAEKQEEKQIEQQEMDEKKQDELKAARETRRNELRAALAPRGHGQLLRLVLDTQQQRVATYRDYER